MKKILEVSPKATSSKISKKQESKKTILNTVPEEVLTKPWIEDTSKKEEPEKKVITKETKESPKIINEEEDNSLMVEDSAIPKKFKETNGTAVLFTQPWIEMGSDCDESLKKGNYLSEFDSEYKKAKARANLGIKNISELAWGKIIGNISAQKDLMALFSALDDSKIDLRLYNDMMLAENHKYVSPDLEGVTNVKEALDRLSYKELVISSLYCQPNSYYENGETVPSITVKWVYNKDKIQEQYLNNILINNTDRYFVDDKGYTGVNTSRSFVLKASDGVKTVYRTANIYFVPGRYYGVANKNTEISTSYIINNFKKSLSLSKGSSFTVNAKEGEHIYLLVPKSMQNIQFSVGGFDGGFNLINSNFSFNKYGNHTEQCCLFESTNAGLGETTVKLK